MDLNEKKYEGLTMNDVWGTKGKGGMIVARGLPDSMDKKAKDKIIKDYGRPTKCPIFGDELGYKDVTVVFDEKDYNAVTYWLSYVHGGDNIGAEQKLEDGKYVIRSNYMCW